MPLSSPDHLNGQVGEVDDIQNEQPPPEMNELACEALTEELKQMQVQLTIDLSVLTAVSQSLK